MIPPGQPAAGADADAGADVGGWAWASGSVTVNSLPWPVPALRAITLPPWASTSARTTVNPMPSRTPLKPKACRSCEKGSKTPGKACALMPMPVSLTVNTRVWRWRRAAR